MAGSRIVSLGHYQPSRVLTNDDLAQMVDTTDEWIQARLGIQTRRIAAGEETVADMASAAAAKALAASGLTAADIDLVAVATCIIFGDGAGAAVVTATEDDEPTGIGPVIWGSAPDKSDSIKIEGWRPYIQQEGQTVFRWATTAIAPYALQACERAGVDPSEIAAFVAHQANARIIDGIARRLNLANAVIAKDIVESGNTSAASIPLALSKLVERREVPSGAPVLLMGFGGGLTYAGQVVRCP